MWCLVTPSQRAQSLYGASIHPLARRRRNPDQMKPVIPLCAGKSAGLPTEANLTAYLAKRSSPTDLLEMIRRLLPEGQGADG